MAGPDVSLVSTKKIPRRERLIFPLDVDTDDEALALVRELGDAVWFYKIGFQLLLGGHYLELVERLADAGKRVFVDLKLFDVPETVASAVRQLSRRRVDFVTVHANEGMLAAACEVSTTISARARSATAAATPSAVARNTVPSRCVRAAMSLSARRARPAPAGRALGIARACDEGATPGVATPREAALSDAEACFPRGPAPR